MNWMPKPCRWPSLFLLLLLGFPYANLEGSSQPTGTPPSGVPQEQSRKAAPPVDANEQSPPADQAPSLSDEVIQQVLEPLRTGMETQDIQQVLSIFDKQELSSYADLQGQLKAFFHLYSEVRFRYQILQATAEKDHGSATAEIEMDALPYQITQVPVRRSVQMRFRMKLETKGWKVVAFTPSDFFGVGQP